MTSVIAATSGQRVLDKPRGFVACDKTGMRLRGVNASSSPEKPTLVLLHGWGSGSWVWQPVKEQLGELFNVWLLDLPGYGDNRYISAPQSVDELVLLCASVLEQLPKPFILLGWSLGGAIASLLADRYSDRVSSLITVATRPSFVSRESGDAGMSLQVFSQFQRNLEADPARLLKRFAILQSKGGKQSACCQQFLQKI